MSGRFCESRWIRLHRPKPCWPPENPPPCRRAVCQRSVDGRIVTPVFESPLCSRWREALASPYILPRTWYKRCCQVLVKAMMPSFGGRRNKGRCRFACFPGRKAVAASPAHARQGRLELKELTVVSSNNAGVQDVFGSSLPVWGYVLSAKPDLGPSVPMPQCGTLHGHHPQCLVPVAGPGENAPLGCTDAHVAQDSDALMTASMNLSM